MKKLIHMSPIMLVLFLLLYDPTQAFSQYKHDHYENLGRDVEFWRWSVVLGRTAQYTRRGEVRVDVESRKKLCAYSLHEASGNPKYSRSNPPRNSMSGRNVSNNGITVSYESPCWGTPVGDFLQQIATTLGIAFGQPTTGAIVGGALRELTTSSQQCVGDQRASWLTMRIYVWTVPDGRTCNARETMIKADQRRRESPIQRWYGDER
ncbi:hypothetical protein IGS68_34775 (plasmid) [Skermanella sp. TT6]|uniref:Uncharacterized protein n=1 Tax=Skermanella cutis TaxID=2775420 RepID=A0ABX7BIT3_9PROT|nr:hypothetical protein [Skermanella sp. TT6]QQP94010.1 hypothetical protein IGS68_34775 [Skermanella sp. TT6]